MADGEGGRFHQPESRAPFFLYVPHPQPHVPLHVSDRFAGKSERGPLRGCDSEIDWSVGEILNAIDTNGLGEDTLVIYTSDNGPGFLMEPTRVPQGPFREGKGTVWEGGIREPTLMRWTGTIPAGTVCDEPGMNIDLLPPLAGLIGAELPQRRIDGLDLRLSSWERRERRIRTKAIGSTTSRMNCMPSQAGRGKLILPHNYRSLDGGREGTAANRRPIKTRHAVALFDLAADPAKPPILPERILRKWRS